MAEAKRGAGPMSSIWVQKEPSHSQVSPSGPFVLEPPNSTTRLRLESKVMELAFRGPGPKLVRCVQRSFAIVSSRNGVRLLARCIDCETLLFVNSYFAPRS